MMAIRSVNSHSMDWRFAVRNKCFLAALTILTLILSTGVLAAGTTRSPSKDTLCLKNGQCHDAAEINITGSMTPAPCSNSQVGYIGWDLSAVSTAISTAQLALTTQSVTGLPEDGLVTFQLVKPAHHTWSENGTDPGFSDLTSPENVLATTSIVLTTPPQQVVFGGVANPADASTLGAHFDSLRSSGAATVGVRISNGCTLSTNVVFEDSEGATTPPPGEPDLMVYGPNAVAVSALSAARTAPAWPLYAGLGAAALIVVAGLAASRRRTA